MTRDRKQIDKKESKQMDTRSLSAIENLTIKQLMDSADETIIRGDEVIIKKVTDEFTMNIKVNRYPGGAVVERSKFENKALKKDLLPTINKMLEDGLTQKDISERLNITQSYISQLINE